MKILVLNYEYPPIGGGAAPVSAEIAKKLAEKGHNITVLTMNYKNLPQIELIDGVKIVRLKCLRTKKMVCHPWEQLTYIISAIRYFSKEDNRIGYDICFTHFIIPTGVISLYLTYRYKIPYIITAHGSDVIGHNNKRFRILYAIIKRPWGTIVRRAKLVISPSQYLEDLMRKNEPNSNYTVIPNGIDTNVFKRVEQRKKKILVMCRLQETKNVQTIIKALSTVELGEWKAVIMGDGPYKKNLERIVENFSLQEYISFTGWVPNKSQEHIRELQETGIYISASKVENCPTSILEAIACGAPILLSDIPAHRQLIGSLANDVFFEPEDSDALSKMIQKIIYISSENSVLPNYYDITSYGWDSSIQRYEAELMHYSSKN